LAANEKERRRRSPPYKVQARSPLKIGSKIFYARVFDLTRRVMTKHALIYRRPSKWPIATALAAAVLIHLSAVAIAFHQEPSPTQPAATDSTTIGIDLADDSPNPPDPDISVPPPVPVPASDFIEPQETPRTIKTQRTPAPIRPSGQTRLAAVGNAKAFVLSAPRPDYPYEARSRRITGSGVAVISVDPNSGLAVDAMMEQSIGNPILDNSTVSAFRRWRFKPGTPARVRIPITFVLTGAQY
jgi:TonB family protein